MNTRTLVTLSIVILCAGSSAGMPAAADGDPVVVGAAFAVDSEVYGTARTLVVHLPLGYEEGGRDYPVLYLVDGGAKQDFIPMAGMETLAYLTGQYRPFILVGVQTENRYHELTVRSDVPEDLAINPDCGGAADFRRHLRDEVMPWVEARYRTSGETALIGESLAGLFIAETFLRAPDTVTHYIAVSPSMWWRNMALGDEAAALLQAPGFPADRSLYLTVASEGGMMQEGIEKLVTALDAHAPEGLRWWYDPMPEEDHHTIYNPATLKALRLVFAPKEKEEEKAEE